MTLPLDQPQENCEGHHDSQDPARHRSASDPQQAWGRPGDSGRRPPDQAVMQCRLSAVAAPGQYRAGQLTTSPALDSPLRPGSIRAVGAAARARARHGAAYCHQLKRGFEAAVGLALQ